MNFEGMTQSTHKGPFTAGLPTCLGRRLNFMIQDPSPCFRPWILAFEALSSLQPESEWIKIQPFPPCLEFN